MSDADFSFFAKGAPDSLRKSGYKDLAYALGELVDNSIQEDATNVDLIVLEGHVNIGNQKRWQVNEIGILDNGNGMDAFRLRCALRHGDGDNQRGNSRGSGGKKMGKFGVGLPQASLSQCKRLEVYSWTEDGPDNANWTYFDWDEPKSFTSIAEPIQKKVPKKWTKAAKGIGTSGTLVIWSKLDRCTWRTSVAIHRNSEFVIGRMYRHHISNGDVNIRLVALEDKSPFAIRWTDKNKDGVMQEDEVHEWDFKANDPLYLDESANANNPPVSPPFKFIGEDTIPVTIIDSMGKKTIEEVKLRFSIAKKETRMGHDYVEGISLQAKGGGDPHGKHAKRNMGLSIVREGRELELDDAWAQGKNVAYERWWGAEVSFGPALDDIFDVSNNKQHAQNLNSARSDDWENYRYDDHESITDIKNRMKDENYPVYVCLTVKDLIWRNLGLLRNQLETTSIKKKADRKSRHKKAEELSKKGIEKRKGEGKAGATDDIGDMDSETRRLKIKESLEKDGLDEDLIEHLTGEIIDSGYQMVFSERELDSDAFFSIKREIGALILFLNEGHSAFKHLFSVLDKMEDENVEQTATSLKRKAEHASAALKLILAAWARMEDEATDVDKKSLQRIRRNWGQVAEAFLPESNDEYEE